MATTQVESAATGTNLGNILNSVVDYYRKEEKNVEVTNIYEDKKIFPDFRSGPLDEYRDKASFCYKRLNVLLEGEEHIRKGNYDNIQLTVRN